MEYALDNESAYKQDYNIDASNFKKVADVNGDGVVNNADLQSLLNLLKSGGSSNHPVPEPSTLVLVVLAALMVGRLRLRFN